MRICKKMVIYLGMKTPQSRKERKYTWQYCLIVSLNCRCWRFVWKDLNIFFGYIERTVQMHSDMVNKCTWVVVEPLWKWLVILLQFPSGPVVLHGTVSIPERLVSHWLARKSYLMTWSVFRCDYWYWLPRQIDLWDKPKPISWLISRNKIQYISEGILWRRILK